ncbi:MAG: hypothetical protein WB460_01925 [Candidatus Acidiferrales bacterium]
MSYCKIVYHRCRPSTEDAGFPFDCDCAEKVTAKEAAELVARGAATWKRQRNANGRIVEIQAGIVTTRFSRTWRPRPSGGPQGCIVMQLVRD